MIPRRVRLLDRPWVGYRLVSWMRGLPPHDENDVLEFLRARWRLGDRGIRWRFGGDSWQLRPVPLEHLAVGPDGPVVDLRGRPDVDVRAGMLDGSLLGGPDWGMRVVMTDDATILVTDHGLGDAMYLLLLVRAFRLFLTDRELWAGTSDPASVRQVGAAATRLVVAHPQVLTALVRRFTRRRRRARTGDVALVSSLVREDYRRVVVPDDSWDTMRQWRRAQPERLSEQVCLAVAFSRHLRAAGVPMDDLVIAGMVDLRRYSSALARHDSNLVGILTSDVELDRPDCMAAVSADWAEQIRVGSPALGAVLASAAWMGEPRVNLAPVRPQVVVSHLTTTVIRDDSPYDVATDLMLRAKVRTVDLLVCPTNGGMMVNAAFDAAFVAPSVMESVLQLLHDDPVGFVTVNERIVP